MGGGISLPEALADESVKPVDCSDLQDADKDALLAEVKRMRELLAANKSLVDTNGDGVGDISPERKFMANPAAPDVLVATKCGDIPAEDEKAIAFTSFKLKKGTEADWRRANVDACQLSRWNWVQANEARWVNMLRKKGFSDADIDACNARTKPLDFLNLEDYVEIKADLKACAAKISERTGVTDLAFIQQGSSVTGFSTNPCKGLRFIPTHLYHETSDTDFRVVGTGIAKAVATAKEAGTAGIIERPGAGVLKPSSGPLVFPELEEVSAKWASKVRGQSSQLQFTVVTMDVATGHDQTKPKLWDLPVQLAA